MENLKDLENKLVEIFEEYKGYIDTVVNVEDALKKDFNWQIGSSEDQGMCTVNYNEVEYVAEGEKASWVYTLPTTNIEVTDYNGEKLEYVEVIAYYKIVETNEELLETKVELTGLEVY